MEYAPAFWEQPAPEEIFPRRNFMESVHMLYEIAKRDGDTRPQLYVINIPDPRDVYESSLEFKERNPDALVRSFFGFGVDLHVGIFNPNRFNPYDGPYDLLIANPESKIK
jgi:hypothetical protein